MSILERLASATNQHSEVLNQELAGELAASGDREGIRELAENLWNQRAAIQSDCVKTLYEIGYIQPELIAPYAADFLKLLRSRNNRLVWGAMIALATIGELAADELYPQAAAIQKAMEKGSVITVDGGVLALARIASHRAEYNHGIFPYLLQHLKTCRPKETPQHAEKILEAVNVENKAEFIGVIEKRLEDASPAQAARLKKVIRKASQR